MKLKEIKERSREIRAEYEGKYHVKWPEDFKQDIVSLLDGGESIGKISKTTGIAQQTIDYWLPSSRGRKKKPKFTEVVASSDPVRGIVLRWSESLEVQGLSFSELCELLSRGLL